MYVCHWNFTGCLKTSLISPYNLIETSTNRISTRYDNGVDVHESVHRDTVMKVTNKMQLYRLIYYSWSALLVSGDVFTHHQEHLTVFTVSGSIHPSCCRLVSRMGWNCLRVYTPHSPHSSVSTRPRHQPAATWVNTTRYCKYSQVLLMMGENIARNR